MISFSSAKSGNICGALCFKLTLCGAGEYDKESDKEKSFLNQFPSAGISVFKSDATLSNFSKLTLNNGQVAKTPCN